MKSPVGAPVPSKSLLRFLHSQTEAFNFQPVCLLAPNPSFPNNAGGNILCQKIGRRLPGSPSHQTTRLKSSNVENTQHLRRKRCAKDLPLTRHYHLDHRSRYGVPLPKNTRNASADMKSQGFFRRHLQNLWKHNPKPSQPKLPSFPGGDTAQYEDTSAQLFNLSRALSRNPSGADLKLRCTEFDSAGSVTLVSGEFKKSELIAKYGLQPRDLRKIDSSILPHILVRPSSILINLLHLRVLIQSDRVLVFDAYGSTDSYTQSLFMYDLEGKLRQKADPRSNGSSTHLPYEFRALEAVLISVTSGLESEFELVRDPVVCVLRELEEDIDREKLRHLLIHSKKLGTFEQKARLVRDAINDLLEADDDLALMYLTERRIKGKSRDENDHQEVEMLLESYHKICDEIVEISGNLISNIRNTEEVVKAILDANRNQLMLLDLKFSIGTLGLAGGTLIAGLYGMNLENFIEESNYGFGGVTIVCFGLSTVIALYGMRVLRRVQKVRMWGENFNQLPSPGERNRGNWMHEAMEHAGRAEKVRKAKIQQGGPVLWPGMDGLGMHKMSGNSVIGDGKLAEEKSSITLRDDIWEEQRMQAQKDKETEIGKCKTVVKMPAKQGWK